MRRTQAFMLIKCRCDPVVSIGHGQHSEKAQKVWKHINPSCAVLKKKEDQRWGLERKQEGKQPKLFL